VRAYIAANPAIWHDDPEHTSRNPSAVTVGAHGHAPQASP
jgi:hypothetical protein